MNAIDLLTTRRSVRHLAEPAPNDAQLEIILQAATQVPDHGNLTPWHFVVVQSEAGRQAFRHILKQCAEEIGGEAARKAEVVGQMAPMVIGVVSKPKLDCLKPKPEWSRCSAPVAPPMPPNWRLRRKVSTMCGLPAYGSTPPRCAKPSAAANTTKSSAC